MQDFSVVEASILFGSTEAPSKSNLKADGFDTYRPEPVVHRSGEHRLIADIPQAERNQDGNTHRGANGIRDRRGHSKHD